MAQKRVSLTVEKGMEAYYAACKEKSLKSISYDLLITKGKAIATELQRAGLADAKDVPSSDAGWKSYVQRFLKKRSITSKRHLLMQTPLLSGISLIVSGQTCLVA